ncbi:hypothetical protein Trydic_g1837 [Trypoxylus dichotomus]
MQTRTRSKVSRRTSVGPVHGTDRQTQRKLGDGFGLLCNIEPNENEEQERKTEKKDDRKRRALGQSIHLPSSYKLKCSERSVHTNGETRGDNQDKGALASSARVGESREVGASSSAPDRRLPIRHCHTASLLSILSVLQRQQPSASFLPLPVAVRQFSLVAPARAIVPYLRRRQHRPSRVAHGAARKPGVREEKASAAVWVS